HVNFLSVIGTDIEGEIVKKQLSEIGINPRHIISDNERLTISKNRILANQQILLRFDSGTSSPIEGTVEKELINSLIEVWVEVDAIIISDYGYGIITDSIIDVIEKLQNTSPRLLLIDSKYLDRFESINASVIKPNYLESLTLLGITKREHGEKRVPQVIQNRKKMYDKVNADFIAVTLDTNGSIIFDKNDFIYRTYAKKIDNPHVSGAGDTYTATLALCLASSADIKTSAEIAAAAANIIVKKSGTAICTKEELEAEFTSQEKLITDRKNLELLINAYKNQKKRIVFSNGCFDILHSGHISYLNQAKSFGDVLLIGINTDESIRKIKGPMRPINSLEDRIRVLSALSCIDHIIPMPENTAESLVALIKPDVYVKGGDYTLDTLPEAKIVSAYGGKIALIPLREGKSTTNIIKRIQSKNSFL
ncbi:MAG TPA: D-glycero-beta-D-manno-heptose 1-phosphate adenylyltransferase, partial [Candidatus Saccharimonadales bacterium]|nr:D-glycero-beta-D-manno-heptose 1-phosphate adenylyltransferase [Candidatus Saccharimonadales bacterium]